MPYAAVLVASSWVFMLVRWRVVGIIYSVLLFGIAAFCFYLFHGNLHAPRTDNPAAGVIALVTVIDFVTGVLAVVCATGVAYLALKSARN